MKVKSVDHAGVRSLDRAASERFYVDVPGLEPHPTKTNRLCGEGGRFGLHPVPGTTKSTSGKDDAGLARHFALEGDDLEGVVEGLIAAGSKPSQADMTAQRRGESLDAGDLSFGIGTVFVFEPDGNLVEFVDPARGLFLDILAQVK